MTKRWYYQMLMEEFGPVTAEQLAALIEEGTVGDTDLIRAEDSDQWFEASQWTPDSNSDSSTVGTDQLDEISDLSELSFEFGESGVNTKPRQPAASSVVETPVTRAPQPAVIDEPEIEPAIYFYQSLGQTLGPLPLSSLISLAEAGALAETDQVRIGNSDPWKPASTVQELAVAFMTADRTIEQAPQLSLATQKRLGEQATAAALAPTPERPSAVDIDTQPVSAAATSSQSTEPSGDSKSEIDTRTRKAGTKGKVTRKEAAKRKEDALLEDIFDDVFSEETPPARPSMAASSSMMATPAAPATYNPSPPPMPISPPMMNNSSASMSRPMLAPTPRSSSSSSGSLMPLLKIVGIVVLVIGVLVGGYYGFSGMTGPPIGLYITKLKMTADDLKKLGDKPTEIQWLTFCAKKNEYTTIQNTILEANATGETVDKCKFAITMVLRAMSTRYKDSEGVKKTSEDFLKAVEKLQD